MTCLEPILDKNLWQLIIVYRVGSDTFEWSQTTLVCKQFQEICKTIPVQRVLTSLNVEMCYGLPAENTRFKVYHSSIRTPSHFYVTGRRLDTNELIYFIGPVPADMDPRKWHHVTILHHLSPNLWFKCVHSTGCRVWSSIRHSQISADGHIDLNSSEIKLVTD